MTDIATIIESLEKGPTLLTGLLAQIPRDSMKNRRIPGKWSIHEHACHLASVERDGILARWDKFMTEARPAIVPLSGESFPPDYYLNMDLDETAQAFAGSRRELTRRARAVSDPGFWGREANHPEYNLYTPFIMLRHILMHDCLHMYRIEELWLTREAFLPGAELRR